MNKLPYQTRFGLSGSTIKCIALVTMLIDHIGVAITGGILKRDYPSVLTNDSYLAYLKAHETLMTANDILRGIGRVAFPLFCFLLVEGFMHTRDAKKYALHLFLFALLSEIPFDLVSHNTWFYLEKQNVFFTLLIGLLMLYLLDQVKKKFIANPFMQILGQLIIILISMGAGYLLQVDYSDAGVACIAVIYLLYSNRIAGVLAACLLLCLSNINEAPCLAAVVLAGLYNGTRGLKLKYFFYAFYPVHLMILFLICIVTGIYTGTILVG